MFSSYRSRIRNKVCISGCCYRDIYHRSHIHTSPTAHREFVAARATYKKDSTSDVHSDLASDKEAETSSIVRPEEVNGSHIEISRDPNITLIALASSMGFLALVMMALSGYSCFLKRQHARAGWKEQSAYAKDSEPFIPVAVKMLHDDRPTYYDPYVTRLG